MRKPGAWLRLAVRAALLLLTAAALSGLWMLLRQCNTMGIVSSPDAIVQMQQARAEEQSPGRGSP